MVKISLEMRFEQGMLGTAQRFQHASVIASCLGALLPSHDKSFQRSRLSNYALSYQ